MAMNTLNKTAAYATDVFPVEEPKQTFSGDVEYAAVLTDELAARIQRLADRLCGCGPTEAGNIGKPIPPDGIFNAVSDRARAIQYRISDANDCLQRIERALP